MELRTYERGGIAYTLAVVERDGQFYVQWKCPICEVEGTMDHGCEVPAEAIGRAQARVFSDHHVPVHVLSHGSFSTGA
jgi:hypothetical protein